MDSLFEVEPQTDDVAPVAHPKEGSALETKFSAETGDNVVAAFEQIFAQLASVKNMFPLDVLRNAGMVVSAVARHHATRVAASEVQRELTHFAQWNPLTVRPMDAVTEWKALKGKEARKLTVLERCRRVMQLSKTAMATDLAYSLEISIPRFTERFAFESDAGKVFEWAQVVDSISVAFASSPLQASVAQFTEECLLSVYSSMVISFICKFFTLKHIEVNHDSLAIIESSGSDEVQVTHEDPRSAALAVINKLTVQNPEGDMSLNEAFKRGPDFAMGKTLARDLADLFEEVVVSCDPATFNAHGLTRDANEVPIATTTVVKMCKAWVLLEDAGSTLSLMRSMYMQNVAIQENMLAIPLRNALSRLYTIPKPDFENLKDGNEAWIVPVLSMEAWWDAFAAFQPRLGQYIVKDLAVHLAQTAASRVKADLPPYNHYVNDSTYSKALCKRHILVPAVRANVKSCQKDVTAMQSHLTDMHSRARLIPNIEKSPEFAFEWSAIDGELAKARACATIIAAASVIQEEQDDREGFANKILAARKGFLPKALCAALESVASNAVVKAKKPKKDA